MTRPCCLRIDRYACRASGYFWAVVGALPGLRVGAMLWAVISQLDVTRGSLGKGHCLANLGGSKVFETFWRPYPSAPRVPSLAIASRRSMGYGPVASPNINDTAMEGSLDWIWWRLTHAVVRFRRS